MTGAVDAALEADETTVLCLTGHNRRARERVERRFGADPRVRVLGFTDQMSDLLAAADALVHSTAGLTVLEAQIRGCPVISYGFAVGHIRANNRAYERFGLAQRGDLARAPRGLPSGPPSPTGPTRTRPSRRFRPSRRWRWKPSRATGPGRCHAPAALRAAAATACTFLLAWEILLTDDAYPLFAKVHERLADDRRDDAPARGGPPDQCSAGRPSPGRARAGAAPAERVVRAQRGARPARPRGAPPDRETTPFPGSMRAARSTRSGRRDGWSTMRPRSA